MAIQVNGTTVIDNSRVLSNVTGLKTINSNSVLGSGDIAVGASTTAGDVGTYTVGRPENETIYNTGDTVSGSSLRVTVSGAWYYTGNWQRVGAGGSDTPSYYGSTRSGTWRLMSKAGAELYSGGTAAGGSGWGMPGLWVRIS